MSEREQDGGEVTNSSVITTADQYYDSLPEPQRSTLRTMRARVLALIPDAHERYSYRIAVYHYRGKDTVALSAYPSHCSLHVMSADIAKLITEMDESGQVRLSGSTVQFPVDEPLDERLLEVAISGRMAEIDV